MVVFPSRLDTSTVGSVAIRSFDEVNDVFGHVREGVAPLLDVVSEHQRVGADSCLVTAGASRNWLYPGFGAMLKLT